MSEAYLIKKIEGKPNFKLGQFPHRYKYFNKNNKACTRTTCRSNY